LQKYDLVREEQNYFRFFSSEQEYFRDGCVKNKNYFNSHQENRGIIYRDDINAQTTIERFSEDKLNQITNKPG
jgi:hypothetical protein